jgi:hypothetical protein
MAAVVLAQAVQATQPEAMSVHVARLKPRKPWLPASKLYDLSKMERAELTRGLLSQAAAEAAQADPIYSKGDDPEVRACLANPLCRAPQGPNACRAEHLCQQPCVRCF